MAIKGTKLPILKNNLLENLNKEKELIDWSVNLGKTAKRERLKALK